MDVMDPHPKFKGFYLVMDNAPIHQSRDIDFAIKQFWSVATVAYTSPPYSFPRTEPYRTIMSQGIAEACYLVTHEGLRGYAAYSASRFFGLLQQEHYGS